MRQARQGATLCLDILETQFTQGAVNDLVAAGTREDFACPGHAHRLQGGAGTTLGHPVLFAWAAPDSPLRQSDTHASHGQALDAS